MRPTITLKLAQSLDGRIATSTGSSRWISGPESRVLAHRMRAEHDAIVVGVGTLLADNPRLTVRLSTGPDPLRVVLDGALRTPLSAAIFGERPDRVLVATTQPEDSERAARIVALGARVVRLPSSPEGVSLSALCAELRSAGIGSLLIEGGARVATSFLRECLVDRLVVFLAPKIVGSGLDAIGDLGISKMDQALAVRDITVDRAGDDVVIVGRVSYE